MRSRTKTFAFVLAVVAVIPYVTLKLLWLAGATVGTRTGTEVAQLHEPRMIVGNLVTIALELVAVGLAFALTRPWGRRVPAWLVIGLSGAATGLLAPILLGLPLGSVLQFAVRGDVHTAGMEHLSPWVFAVVYGGFGLLAIAIAALTWSYVLDRWGHLLGRPPRPPAAWATGAGALGLLPFGAIMLGWGILGPGESGPQAMDTPAQRTVLVVTGLLAIAGFVTPLLPTARARYSPAAWLITWVGCTTAALQGPTQVLLANGGHPTPAIAVVALVSTPGACTYGLAVLRRRIIEARSRPADPGLGRNRQLRRA